MEVGRNSDVLYLDAYAATHRRELRSFRILLILATCLVLVVFAWRLHLIERQKQSWRNYHVAAMKAVDAALHGDPKANLPSPVGVDFQVHDSYRNLYFHAQRHCNDLIERDHHVDRCLSGMEDVCSRVSTADFAQLQTDYANVEQLARLSKVDACHPWDFEHQLRALQSEWEAIRWKDQDLDFRVELENLQRPPDVEARLRNLIARSTTLLEDTKAQATATLGETPVLFVPAKYEDWSHTIPLTPDNLQLSRYRVMEGLGSALASLLEHTSRTELLLEYPGWTLNPLTHQIEPTN